MLRKSSFFIFPISLSLSFLLCGLTGCGYSFQSTRSPLYEKEGIHRLYVAPLVNNTYKAGIENIVYNQLVRVLAAHGGARIVSHKQEADAILDGTVSVASYGSSAVTQVANLKPTGLGASLPTAPFLISTEYTANLACSFVLSRAKKQLWAGAFSRAKPFPAANQLDVPGMTAPLINESEFDRALGDIAKSMMEDVKESMLANF